MTNGIEAPQTNAEWNARLTELWQYSAKRYSAGFSSSMREETALDLLKSVDFTLSRWLNATGISKKEALLMPAREMLLAAQDKLLSDVKALKRAYGRLGAMMPKTGSDALKSTFAAIGRFFELYDAMFMSALIPCDIDYQLAIPVSEKRLGADYISDYLSEIATESAFISRFDAALVERLLTAWRRDWRLEISNIFEPVFACALALSMLSLPPRTLMLKAEDLARLHSLFEPFDEEGVKKKLLSGVSSLESALSFSGFSGVLSTCAFSLAPRITAGARLANIFISVKPFRFMLY
ncbi:MAG: DUF6179 domain-containing protein [Eubacteriales bacterium]|nr:DUF6179 domain-containing protein [Eubacteriales bacterium]MDD3881020.1 DUF6179 domain-containing protein [Eubacteriales bacterium]MDD4511911.1 DUF6179 domain-containing protein [Eubacteriales bacterium]